ncbi:MAG: MarR family transcriptional regulator [Acidimicrobiales bacterium]|jgi:DNA-binding MarR family transcriptional regulator|nr:MarR family transcriptional regulator [Acidimicrobiales bacterium]HLV90753.1 MarR family transcriptional regulator [Acidimicrobiia bacterium]
MPSRIPENSRDDSEAVADLLGVLWRRVHHETMRRIDSPGITPARLRALRFVGRADTPVRMGELAERLGIVPRSATTLVDELADAGWVRRLPDPDDRRATLVEVTNDGQNVLADAGRIRREVAAEMFASLSPADLAKLRTLLSAAVDA